MKLSTGSKVSLSVLTNTSDWSEFLASVHDTVLFIDEDVRYLYRKVFSRNCGRQTVMRSLFPEAANLRLCHIQFLEYIACHGEKGNEVSFV